MKTTLTYITFTIISLLISAGMVYNSEGATLERKFNTTGEQSYRSAQELIASEIKSINDDMAHQIAECELSIYKLKKLHAKGKTDKGLTDKVENLCPEIPEFLQSTRVEVLVPFNEWADPLLDQFNSDIF